MKEQIKISIDYNTKLRKRNEFIKKEATNMSNKEKSLSSTNINWYPRTYG